MFKTLANHIRGFWLLAAAIASLAQGGVEGAQFDLMPTVDFESYTLGDVNTDMTGTTTGQGGWYTFNNSTATGQKKESFQIVDDPASPASKGMVFKMVPGTTAAGNNVGRFAWTDDIKNRISSNPEGNSIFIVVYDFYFGGASTTSTSKYGAYLYDATGTKILAGVTVQNNTGQFYLVGNYNNAGTVGNFSFSTQTGGILTRGQWYRFAITFDKTTGRVVAGFSSNGGGSYAMFYVDGAAAGATPGELDLIGSANSGTAAQGISRAGYYNDIRVYSQGAGSALPGAPTVVSTTAASIISSGATLGGNVTADGGSTVTERGIVYALTSANNAPAIGGTGVTKVAEASGGTGAFTVNVTGLSAGTGYSFKAYAINNAGTAYGDVSTFITSASTSASSDATLSALSLSSGTLSPSFASATTIYTASVGNAVTSVTVTPTVSQANATVRVRVNSGSWASVTSGAASGSLSLSVGTNTVEVEVTAEDATTTKTYSVSVTRRTNLEDWRVNYFSSAANAGNGANTANPQGDGLSNLEKYAFGLDPTASLGTGDRVAVSGGTITRGRPTIDVQSNSSTSIGVKARFVRRKTHLVDGLTYTVRFSNDLSTWLTSTATPTVVASDADFEVVEVPYPLFIGGKKAGFFSVVLDLVNND